MLRRGWMMGIGVGIAGLLAVWMMVGCGGTETVVETVVVERQVMVDREIAVPETVVVEVERLVVETVVVERVVERPVVETVVVEKQVVVEAVREVEVPVTVEVIKEVDASGSPVREVTVVVEKEVPVTVVVEKQVDVSGSPVREVTVVVEKEVEVPVTVVVEKEVVKEVEVVVEKEVTKIVEVLAPTATATPLPEIDIRPSRNISANGRHYTGRDGARYEYYYSAHSCGLRPNGAVDCWGQHARTIGSDRREVWEVWGYAVGQRGDFVQVSSGGTHACGLTTRGNAVCWSQIGDTSISMNGPGSRFAEISVGNTHACGLRDNGEIECWGLWDYETPPGQYVGVAAGGGRRSISSSPTSGHSCGLRENGDAECWGNDSHGQAQSVRGRGFVMISAGGKHTCALSADGQGACWGGTGEGKVVTIDGPFKTISAGWEHTCALFVDGEATCWGEGEYGKSVPPSGPFTEIAAGYDHSCGLLESGEVVCWGKNLLGESSPPTGSFGRTTAASYGGTGRGKLFDAASVLARFSADDAFVGEARAAAAGEILGLYRSGMAEADRVLEFLHVMAPELSIEERRRAYEELSRLRDDGNWDTDDTVAAVDQLAALITGDELNAGGRVAAAKELVARYESGDLNADRALALMDTIAPGLSINQRRQAAVTLARLSADGDWDDADRMVAANEVFRLVTGVPLDFERRTDAAVDLAGVGVTIFGNGGEISDSQVSAATTVIKQGLAGNLTSETVQGILGFGN